MISRHLMVLCLRVRRGPHYIVVDFSVKLVYRLLYMMFIWALLYLFSFYLLDVGVLELTLNTSALESDIQTLGGDLELTLIGDELEGERNFIIISTCVVCIFAVVISRAVT